MVNIFLLQEMSEGHGWYLEDQEYLFFSYITYSTFLFIWST